jgi:hypothetical protein
VGVLTAKETAIAVNTIQTAISLEKSCDGLYQHDFQKLNVSRNATDETRLLAADLVALRMRKLWNRKGAIILGPDNLAELWERT